MPAVILLAIIAIIAGILILAIIYFSSVTTFKIAKAMFGDVGGGRIPSATRDALRDARQYAKLMRKTAYECPPGLVRDRMERTVQPVDDWLNNLKRLEQALVKLYAQRNLAREMRRANFEIEQLRREILMATSANEVASLRALVTSKKKHYSVLEELQRFQSEAELKIRKIASDLGTTHAEMLLVVTRGDFSEGRFRRMDESLQENLASLRDMVTVMDEMTYPPNTTAAFN